MENEDDFDVGKFVEAARAFGANWAGSRLISLTRLAQQSSAEVLTSDFATPMGRTVTSEADTEFPLRCGRGATSRLTLRPIGWIRLVGQRGAGAPHSIWSGLTHRADFFGFDLVEDANFAWLAERIFRIS